jgi:hypothetical protein
MPEQLAEKFIEALRDLEENKNVDRIAEMFADGADIHNVVTMENSHDLDAREFWTKYRENFGEITSEFRNKITGDDRAALEWTSSGTNLDGQSFQYEGVSILEFDGDRITRFFAYFDPARLGRQMTEETARGKEA